MQEAKSMQGNGKKKTTIQMENIMIDDLINCIEVLKALMECNYKHLDVDRQGITERTI